MSVVCSRIVPSSDGMSTSFLYESAKDVLKWNNMSIQKHIQDVMYIGRLIYMKDEDFEEVKNKREFLEVDINQLQEFYKM